MWKGNQTPEMAKYKNRYRNVNVPVFICTRTVTKSLNLLDSLCNLLWQCGVNLTRSWGVQLALKDDKKWQHGSVFCCICSAMFLAVISNASPYWHHAKFILISWLASATENAKHLLHLSESTAVHLMSLACVFFAARQQCFHTNGHCQRLISFQPMFANISFLISGPSACVQYMKN